MAKTKTKQGPMGKARIVSEDGSGESLWVEQLPDDKYKLWNVPLDPRYNLHDIVRCEEVDGRLTVVELVERLLAEKEGVQYDPLRVKEFTKFVQDVETAGAHVEGMVPGLAIISYPKDFDLTGYITKHHEACGVVLYGEDDE